MENSGRREMNMVVFRFYECAEVLGEREEIVLHEYEDKGCDGRRWCIQGGDDIKDFTIVGWLKQGGGWSFFEFVVERCFEDGEFSR